MQHAAQDATEPIAQQRPPRADRLEVNLSPLDRLRSGVALSYLHTLVHVALGAATIVAVLGVTTISHPVLAYLTLSGVLLGRFVVPWFAEAGLNALVAVGHLRAASVILLVLIAAMAGALVSAPSLWLALAVTVPAGLAGALIDRYVREWTTSYLPSRHGELAERTVTVSKWAAGGACVTMLFVVGIVSAVRTNEPVAVCVSVMAACSAVLAVLSAVWVSLFPSLPAVGKQLAGHVWWRPTAVRGMNRAFSVLSRAASMCLIAIAVVCVTVPVVATMVTTPKNGPASLAAVLLAMGGGVALGAWLTGVNRTRYSLKLGSMTLLAAGVLVLVFVAVDVLVVRALVAGIFGLLVGFSTVTTITDINVQLATAGNPVVGPPAGAREAVRLLAPRVGTIAGVGVSVLAAVGATLGGDGAIQGGFVAALLAIGLVAYAAVLVSRGPQVYRPRADDTAATYRVNHSDVIHLSGEQPSTANLPHAAPSAHAWPGLADPFGAERAERRLNDAQRAELAEPIDRSLAVTDPSRHFGFRLDGGIADRPTGGDLAAAAPDSDTPRHDGLDPAMVDQAGVATLADATVMSATDSVVTQPAWSFDLAPGGYFVAIEGADGVGKSTVLTHVAAAIAEHNRFEVVSTREPGGTQAGKELRQLLLHGHDWSDRAEALLFAADRAHHVDTVIQPALDRGALVITDRFMDSSIAYQGAGRRLRADEVGQLSLWATAGLVPNVTFILDIDPTVAAQRRTRDANRGGADRIEGEAVEFQHRVRDHFLAMAAANPDRYCVIDASAEPHTVAVAILEQLRSRLGAAEPTDVAPVSHHPGGPSPSASTPAAVALDAPDPAPVTLARPFPAAPNLSEPAPFDPGSTPPTGSTRRAEFAAAERARRMITGPVRRFVEHRDKR